ncbi:MAG: UvrB/UvrC motif-containing protein [Pirellulales bacterium]|nr:UvrB/UvrC motif-containing protein [Pirellulales bacterium]
MSNDLTEFLEQWRFEPDEVSVRIIPGDDGRSKIQLRIDLGVLQMEMEGRPDGDRPMGCESWFEHYRRRQEEHDERHPDSAPFLLDEKDCLRLWREAVQYYHRYLSFWHLDMYERCAGDTARNLRLFSFVRAHVRDERLKLQFDQWRPYVAMMHARAVATPLLQQRLIKEGLQAIESGIEAVREFLDDYDQGHRSEECVELVSLEQWRDEILAAERRAAEERPKSKAELLRRRLEAAVAAEEFEEAARLRDQLRGLKKK